MRLTMAARLPARMQAEIISLYRETVMTHRDIASRFGVSRTAVGNVVRRDTVIPPKLAKSSTHQIVGYGRCHQCGAMCSLPCLACAAMRHCASGYLAGDPADFGDLALCLSPEEESRRLEIRDRSEFRRVFRNF